MLGWVLTFRTHLKLRGLWVGIICGVFTTAVLCLVSLLRTDWAQEAHLAAVRTGTHGKLECPIDDTTVAAADSSSSSGHALEPTLQQQQRQVHAAAAAAVTASNGELQDIELSPVRVHSASDLPV